jgi:hypothetical protein
MRNLISSRELVLIVDEERGRMKRERKTGEEVWAPVVVCALTGNLLGWDMSTHLNLEVLEMEVPDDALQDGLKRLWYVHLWTCTTIRKEPFKTGARGYVLKGSLGEDTMRAINAVSRGEAIFSPGIARRLIQYFEALHPVHAPVQPSLPSIPFPDLTRREQEILTLIAQGYTNSAIVEKRVLSSSTV